MIDAVCKNVTQNAQKLTILRAKSKEIFPGMGHSPLPDPSPSGERGHTAITLPRNDPQLSWAPGLSPAKSGPGFEL